MRQIRRQIRERILNKLYLRKEFVMKPKKRNSFFTFVFSFVPGAVEMYMGLLKNGGSILAVFMLAIMVPVILNAEDVLFGFAVVVYCVSFFHARNMAKASDAELETMEDKYVWEDVTSLGKLDISTVVHNRVFAIVLILIGSCLIWNSLVNYVAEIVPGEIWMQIAPLLRSIPGIVVAGLIIYLGIKLMCGKKEKTDGED